MDLKDGYILPRYTNKAYFEPIIKRMRFTLKYKQQLFYFLDIVFK
jgi:hypothetical protein